MRNVGACHIVPIDRGKRVGMDTQVLLVRAKFQSKWGHYHHHHHHVIVYQ